MSDVVGSFLDENEASRTLAPKAVGSQAALMAGISVLTISGALLFFVQVH